MGTRGGEAQDTERESDRYTLVLVGFFHPCPLILPFSFTLRHIDIQCGTFFVKLQNTRTQKVNKK